MDCFTGCFGFKDCGRRNSLFFLWKNKEPVEPRKQYTSLVSSKEKATPSKNAKKEDFQEIFYGDDCVHHEQRQEAKLRKNYGVIFGNHVEFNKPSNQQYVVSEACKMIDRDRDQQLDESSYPPSKVPQTSTILEEKSNSCQLEDHDDKSSKTLLFEEIKHSIVEKELESMALDVSPQIKNQMQPHVGDSPFPTPLNLMDGMQTPGTIYPPKSEIFRTSMLRAQFAYPIPDLPNSTFGLKVAGDGSENTKKIYDSPNVDRPIIGAIVAHWDEEVPSCVSLKSCDSNEILNHTTKHNEDLKVSWHATPFGLSDEKILIQRKLDGKTD